MGGLPKRNAHADQDVEEDDPRIIDEDDPFNLTNDFHSEDDDAELLTDQRSPIEYNWSVNGVNRAVLVGTSIKPDSDASVNEGAVSLDCVSQYCIITIMNAYVC